MTPTWILKPCSIFATLWSRFVILSAFAGDANGLVFIGVANVAERHCNACCLWSYPTDFVAVVNMGGMFFLSIVAQVGQDVWNGASWFLMPCFRYWITPLFVICHDSLAEWSKALASGASPQGRAFEPHSCHMQQAKLTYGTSSTPGASCFHGVPAAMAISDTPWCAFVVVVAIIKIADRRVMQMLREGFAYNLKRNWKIFENLFPACRKGCSGNWTQDLSHPKRESCH